MKNKLKSKKYMIFGIMLLLLTGCGLHQKTIRFGAAGIGGMYDAFANAYVSIANKEENGLKLETKNTAGSAANIRLLSGRYIELGIAQADLVEEAYGGTGEFKDEAYQGYQAVANLYPEACQIVVLADSDIESTEDLLGKRISIGEAESGTERNAKQILSALGMNNGMVEMVNLDYTKAAAELADGEIDAFFCTAGIKTNVIEELAKESGIRLLDIGEDCRNRLLAAYPSYSVYTVPADTYTGQSEDVETLCVQAVLLASEKLSEDTVKLLTELLFVHEKDIRYAASINLSEKEEDAVNGITIPFHKGAAAYYAEHGIEVKTE